MPTRETCTRLGDAGVAAPGPKYARRGLMRPRLPFSEAEAAIPLALHSIRFVATDLPSVLLSIPAPSSGTPTRLGRCSAPVPHIS